MPNIKEKLTKHTAAIPKKRKTILACLGLALLGFSAWSAWQHLRPHPLIAEGSIEATQIIIRSETSGVITQCLLEEGSPVQPDTTLFIIDGATANFLEEQSLARLQSLEAQLAELKGGNRQELVRQGAAAVRQSEGLLKKAQANLAVQEKTYQRYQELFAAGGLSQQGLDQQATLLEQAKGDVAAVSGQLQSAQEQYRYLQNGASPETISALEAKVREAAAAYAQSKDNHSKGNVLAPVHGIFREKLVEAGEYVNPGTALCVLTKGDSLSIVGYVPAKQLSQVKLGQPVWVKVDAWPKEAFNGKVVYIADEAEFTPLNKQTGADRADLVFAVKVSLADSQGKLLAGMPADIYFAKP